MEMSLDFWQTLFVEVGIVVTATSILCMLSADLYEMARIPRDPINDPSGISSGTNTPKFGRSKSAQILMYLIPSIVLIICFFYTALAALIIFFPFDLEAISLNFLKGLMQIKINAKLIQPFGIIHINSQLTMIFFAIDLLLVYLVLKLRLRHLNENK